eukprot:gnl/TRDRNA2_/TRDRNA2_137093_c0_seq1.p1 gnl/TRDRNA2_/TRDRNA2_137093_c0~~gnl/TRDRNA2_/TRDRNA2_137093_c0_seq1.p1  ORF type:complete len:285 (+),score=58.49 gnl/TRDRNA2_/TRDRNA2_137093_c0_seq1:117-971(+)
MGRFSGEVAAHRAALEALKGDFLTLTMALPVAGPDGVLTRTLTGLDAASASIDNVYASRDGRAVAAAASGLIEAAAVLEALQPAHQQLHEALAAAAGRPIKKDQINKAGAKPRSKSAGSRAPVDFSAFTRARWEAEHRKGALMLGEKDAGELEEAGTAGVKVWIQDVPKPIVEEKPCTQVKGRHILVNTCEKVRKIFVEIAATGNCDRIGYIRGANQAKFHALAVERSDCPTTGKKGGDLGWVVKGKLEKRFEECIFCTPKGACTPPFKTSKGFHMFYCEDRRG